MRLHFVRMKTISCCCSNAKMTFPCTKTNRHVKYMYLSVRASIDIYIIVKMKSVTPKLKQKTKPTHQAAVFSTGILSQSMAFIFKNMKMTRGREGCVYRQVMVDFILKLSSIILYTCKTSIYINAPGKYTTCDRH